MPASPLSLGKRYRQTQDLISDFVDKHHRNSEDVKLIAVSKRHSAQNVSDLIGLGHTEFAENYLQEAEEKIAQVNTLLKHSSTTSLQTFPVWHFIGHIQSRKCKSIAQNFDWVHTVESIKVAQKLDQHRQGMAPLNVLIQLNLQQEDSKSGISTDNLHQLASEITKLPNLILRGLMIIPKSENEFELQRNVFRQCRETMQGLNDQGFQLDQLSMGMSNDMEAAIAEGATMIRIGTAIFGQRPD